MFELSQLRCFVAVARELNFRRAAEHLHMTQPPLSRQIQLLEDDLNVKLFERTSRSVRLTAAGKSFFVEAQDLLKRAEAASLTARQAEAGQHGSISFGFIPVAAFDIMPRVIKAVGDKAPGVNLLLHEMLTIEQIEALTAGRTELGLIRLPGKGSDWNSDASSANGSFSPFMLAIRSSRRRISGSRISTDSLSSCIRQRTAGTPTKSLRRSSTTPRCGRNSCSISAKPIPS
ncbi:LysR family transcriptional regulator [Ensifer psoraleae]|uniref:LysR family transcriptional regulator n=1 Tax=Sinorhizobium psoraleae TaxID=520838 RepID=A0ABT4KBP8_9HYPH|nr:LysR family transcriptional regulator [Sinorhizobium psoraleae]MCZ4088786.1 LysR family transcriptional regulator [Sinorhizobium psoraleae]